MAVENVTGELNQKTFRELMCSAELAEEAHGHLIFLSALHICLSITAFLGNSLILVALCKERCLLHPPSKLLYRSLAITDLSVGLTGEPLYVTSCIAALNKQRNICRQAVESMIITSYILCGVSLMTLTAISVDRLLALLLGLRYRQVVTLKRTYLAVIAFCVVPIVAATMFVWNPLTASWCGNVVTLLCLVISVSSYTKIFLTLRHQNQIQVQNQVFQLQVQPGQAIPQNIARYRKAVSSALWLQATLVVCYLPYGIVAASTPQGGLPFSIYLATIYSITLIYLNSTLNPFLYCWKISEVRQAVKQTIRQLCYSWS